MPGEPKFEPQIEQSPKEDKYSLEAVREDISHKADKIRKWGESVGLIEGKDFKVIESIRDTEEDDKTIAPHELREFGVIVGERYYFDFKKYIEGQYTEERKRENPDNKYGGPNLDYSWGGRFAVINDGVFIDTAAASDVEKLSIPTHHEEFLKFFEEKAGFEFPTSETLNPLLKEISDQGLEIYKSALEKLRTLQEQDALPCDGYGLIDAMEHLIMILNDAKDGEALVDLPEVIEGDMPAKTRHYADLTYNAESLKDLDRVTEITGIAFSDDIRVDKIYDKHGFNRKEMENICHDFSDYLDAKKDAGG